MPGGDLETAWRTVIFLCTFPFRSTVYNRCSWSGVIKWTEHQPSLIITLDNETNFTAT